MKYEHVNLLLALLAEHQPEDEAASAAAALLRALPEMEEIDGRQQGETHLWAVRDPDGVIAWIILADGAGQELFTPDAWRDRVGDYAAEKGWDDVSPHVATAGERAGIHAATGIQYDPSEDQRDAAAMEEFQCRMFREICGLAE